MTWNYGGFVFELTWTMATCKRVPRRPTAMEAAAMTAGPVRNLTAMAKVAIEFPHAMILGCNAINRPVTNTKTTLPNQFLHLHPTHILSVFMFSFYHTPFHHHHHPTSSFLLPLYLCSLYHCMSTSIYSYGIWI